MLKGGRIVFNGGHSTASCIIKNMSEDGARLKLDGTSAIPSLFTLRFDDDSTLARECTVQWHAPDALGVRFTAPVAPTSTTGGRSDSRD
jgi:hypothetical protein